MATTATSTTPTSCAASGGRPSAVSGRRNTLRTAGLAVSAVLLAVAATPLSPVAAAVGDLDPSFGGDGRVTTSFGAPGDGAMSVVIQPDGRIIAAGGVGDFFSGDFAVTRYNSDGSLDTSFSGDGKVTTDLGGDDDAAGVALQADGGIVVVGSSENQVAVVRYNADGTLDSSFAGDGTVTTDVAEEGNAVAVQPDGRIVVGGHTWTGNDFAVLRFTTAGGLDPTFSGDGLQTTDFGDGIDIGRAVALQGDGRIVVAGAGGPGDDFAVARYTSDGALDTTFSGDGRQTTDFGRYDEAYDITLQGDGRIVLAGGGGPGAGNGYADFALARYDTDGSLDTGFAGDGTVTTGFMDDDWARGVVVQPDGRIVAAGNNGSADFALARYLPDGSLDTSFGGGGQLTTDFGMIEIANDVTLQPDGKIIAAGVTDDFNTADFALARYQVVDTEPPNTTIRTGPSGTTTKRTARFTFRSSEAGSRFECRIDRGARKACSSPKTYRNLGPGRHVFRVWATDQAGNTDPTPATRSWKIRQ